MKKTDPVFTPELIKVIKIFGLTSLVFVGVLMFFNDRKAQNSGKYSVFQMADADKIFFLNLRSTAYDRIYQSEANMTIFKSSKRQVSSLMPLVDLVLILNTSKDEAYLHLDPVNHNWPITVRVKSDVVSQEFTFVNGNKFDQQLYIQQIRPWIEQNASFELLSMGIWIPIWNTTNEKEILNSILEDYLRLINQLD